MRRNLKLQPNKNAEDPTVKKEARKKDQYVKRVTSSVPLTDDGLELHPSVTQPIFETQFIDALDDRETLTSCIGTVCVGAIYRPCYVLITWMMVCRETLTSCIVWELYIVLVMFL
ncbi:hypothetical protein AN958_00193 [Leucoagaricus sp. SymC.cos]|nr:hypothetical protein AN958_00193 [Leucoagaricus sp. SymC.cos]